MSRRQEILILGHYRVAAVGIGTYQGQVLVIRRRTTDPIVLFQCEHAHRLERKAEECAENWVEESLGNR